MSTYAQRLQWQHEELHGPDELSPAEQHEIEDEQFRHWDTFTFARVADATQMGISRERGAAASSASPGGPPNLLPAADTESQTSPPASDAAGREALVSTSPLEGQGLAPSWEHHAWRAA